ncbi:MAG: alkylhydroperoxidase family enzyme [Patiriisocius sp.]|jgi:alkylhydroperoxidase family enzyme
MTFTIHTLDSATQDASAELERSQKAFGFIPNLHAVLAEAPSVLTAYKELHTLFQNSSFNNEELTVVWQTVNVENECHYCIPAHTVIAHMMKVDPTIIDALRSGDTLTSEKLQTLRDTTLALLRLRGRLDADHLEAFHAVGYGNQQLLEIILGIAQKTISNYSNHLADTPVDAPFQKYR